MYNIVITDYSGNSTDLQFLENDHWLNDTKVLFELYCSKARWKIKIYLLWAVLPFRMIIKYIPNDYPSKEKAEIFANYYLKTIKKDKRGELKINHNDYTICNN